jgi:hypothetical protein
VAARVRGGGMMLRSFSGRFTVERSLMRGCEDSIITPYFIGIKQIGATHYPEGGEGLGIGGRAEEAREQLAGSLTGVDRQPLQRRRDGLRANGQGHR